MKKNIILSTVIITAIACAVNFYAPENTLAAQQPTKSTTASATKTQIIAIPVSALDLVKNPNFYLNKQVKINAKFDKFSTLGLDYVPALKKSEDYISFLISREDIPDHNVPLSEMKIFLKRTMAEKFIDLETGDKIEFEGKVFSTALSDPWIEVTKLTILSPKKSEKNK